MNLKDIAASLSLTVEKDIEISEFYINSAKVQPGGIFVAIRGDRLDGHDFINDAVAHGASAVLCSKAQENLSVPQLLVDDTLQALQQIARQHRKKYPCPAVALTGSNGKTSVKEMIASILPSPSLSTTGNLNNHIGVPLTVLRLNAEHRYAVFELGANHPGEIALTVSIARPQVALINNIGPAHLEGFGSIDGVARAKGEIYQGLAENGVAVVNDDDTYAHFWDNDLKNKQVIRFSASKNSDVRASELSFDAGQRARFQLTLPDGQQTEISLQVPGAHQVNNALAAASCCFGLGLDIEQIAKGLNRFSGVAGRMATYPGLEGALLIDDTYNANLRSTLAALDVLAAREGVRIFAFGDMGELGQQAEAHHIQVGEEAKARGIDYLFTIGKNSALAFKAFGGKGGHFQSKAELAESIRPLMGADSTVLLKASRSMALEELTELLKKNDKQRATA